LKIAMHGTGAMGKTIKELGGEKIVAFVDNIEEIKKDEQIDVVIDFSHFSKLNSLIDSCVERKYPLVIATTGYTGETLEKLLAASKHIPILLSSNTSLGLLVQWTIRLCQYVGLDSGCTEHCDPHKSLNKLLFIYVPCYTALLCPTRLWDTQRQMSLL